jgi:hypothetical protein
VIIYFRLWETMTMGAVAVIERAVGLDKTVQIFLSENNNF